MATHLAPGLQGSKSPFVLCYCKINKFRLPLQKKTNNRGGGEGDMYVWLSVMCHHGVRYGNTAYSRIYTVLDCIYGKIRYGVRYGPNFESLSQKIKFTDLTLGQCLHAYLTSIAAAAVVAAAAGGGAAARAGAAAASSSSATSWSPPAAAAPAAGAGRLSNCIIPNPCLLLNLAHLKACCRGVCRGPQQALGVRQAGLPQSLHLPLLCWASIHLCFIP